MKAVVLVGGQGTRLRPLTYCLPKPMIPLLNRPFLEHVIAYLKSFGIDEIVLSLGYQPAVIQSYFGDGQEFGVHLAYVVEAEPLGTAGGVKNVEQHLDGTFFVFNGDVFCTVDLAAMLRLHNERQAKVTIALTPVDDPSAYGLVKTDSQQRVLAFLEKPGPEEITTNLINAGIYIIEPEAMSHVPQATYHMFERGLFPLLIERGDTVMAFASDSYWIDMGTPEKYLTVHRDLLHGRARCTVPGRSLGQGIWAEDDVNVHFSATVIPPVVLGKGVTVGARAVVSGPVVLGESCVVGEDCFVEDAVLWDRVVLGNKVRLTNCVIGSGNVLGDGVVVAGGAVIANDCHVGKGNRLDRGIRLMPGSTVRDDTITF